MTHAGGSLPEDHADRIRELRTVARNTLGPVAARGEPHRVNRPLVRALAEHGLLARVFPHVVERSKRTDVSAVELCLLREGLACESAEAETALALQGLGAYPILQAGQETTRRRWIPAVVSGEAVAAFALTEPDAGSDAAALSLAAEPDGDGWRLSGEKAWISNAPEADVYSVFARTTSGAGAQGVTAFAVAGNAEGLSGSAVELLSDHPVGRLVFDGVRVTPSDVLGTVDAGFRVAMATLDLFRPSVGAFAVGMAQAALESAVAHAERRETFGKPLHTHQAIAHTLADMATRTLAARLLVYHAAARYDARADRVRKDAAMAKLYATEVAQEVVDAAVQIHGARGLERGHRLEHLYRDVRSPRIYEGTSEIQRTIIARELYR